jgi:apolipoprotein N-acyltransferase
LFLSTSLLFAAVAFVATFWIAYQDPLEEEGVAGALARVLGRWTIQSVETTTPKIRAVARAAITSQEEITQLQSRVQVLEQQHAELVLWKERRLAVDRNLDKKTVEELKEMARQNNLAVGGKKHELMMRLLEAQVLQLSKNTTGG